MQGMTKVFNSNLVTKIGLIYEMYDFDRNGLISKEDVRVILTYVPSQTDRVSPKST